MILACMCVKLQMRLHVCHREGPFWAHFGSILVHFGSILGPLWVHFGSTLGPFWVHFGSILGPFWVHFGSILGPFWVHFGSFWVHFGSILGPLWEHAGYCLNTDAFLLFKDSVIWTRISFQTRTLFGQEFQFRLFKNVRTKRAKASKRSKLRCELVTHM